MHTYINTTIFVLVVQSNDVSRGRPKGSTEKRKSGDSLNEERALSAVTSRLLAAREETQNADPSRNTRVANEVWKRICLAVSSEFSVPIDFLLARKHMAYARIRRGNVTGARGVSPVQEMEPLLMEMILTRQRMKQPLNKSEVLQFANSLIFGSTMKENLKTKHHQCGRSDEMIGVLGDTWFRNFTKRYKNQLSSSRPVPFPNRRTQWATYDNFKIMYDETYRIWEELGIAEKLETPQYLDRDGMVVPFDQRNGCLPSEYRLLHPEAILSADEVGNNTGTTKDKLQGNEKRLHIKNGERPQKIASESDTPWTTLAVTAMTGEPVCCVVIIKGSQFHGYEVTGEDITADNDRDQWCFSDSSLHGPGRRFPGGPCCMFRGKKIPCLVSGSKSGGITSEILTSILKHLDECGIYDRDTDPFTPTTIQMDSHHTRFALDFLSYCVQKETKWMVTIGCPEATHLWQVQDATELNGRHKTEMYKAKEKLLTFRRSMGLSLDMNRKDIIPLVNRAWNESFAVVETNRNAIEERGWNPMNAALLNHPAIVSTKPTTTEEVLPTDASPPNSAGDDDAEIHSIPIRYGEESSQVSATVINCLNTTMGTAGAMYTDALMYIGEQERLKANVRKRVADQKTFSEKAKEAKRISPGFLFSNGIVGITSDESYLAFREKGDLKQAKEKAAISKVLKEYSNLIDAVKAIMTKVKKAMLKSEQYSITNEHVLTLPEIPVTFLNVSQLKTLLRFQYRKQKGDKGFSKLNLQNARQMWLEVRQYQKLLVTQVLSEADELPITVPRIPEQARQDANRTVVLAEANTETNAIPSQQFEASQAHANQIARLNPARNAVPPQPLQPQPQRNENEFTSIPQEQGTYRTSLISLTATSTEPRPAIHSNTTNEDQATNGAMRGIMQLPPYNDASEEGTASL